jgi:hypothetical protein
VENKKCLNAKVLSEKSGGLTDRLNLPNSRLQHFVRKAVSVNPFQRIYGETEATLLKRCYKFIRSHPSYLLKSYTQSWKT